MKQIYITGNDKELIDVLAKVVRDKFSKELIIEGEEPFSEDVITNCGYAQPDFLICDYIPRESAIDFFKACPNKSIVFVSTDTNRANALITDLNKLGYYDIMSLNKDTTTPEDLCRNLIEYEENLTDKPIPQPEIKIPKDIELPKINLDVAVDSPTIEEGDDLLSMDELNKMLSEETPEAVEKKNEEIKRISRENMERISEREKAEANNTASFSQISLANFKSKTIAVYSKKGGTGKTTIAKELGNIFSSVKLPKKLSNGSQNLKTVVVDLDFESGNLRTFLGIDNPAPNVYMWINDILDKLEDGMSPEKIYYSPMVVMQNYSILLNGNYRILPTDQGDLSPRVISRILNLDQDGTLLQKIVKIIIKSLQRTFDIVIIDCGSTYDDLTQIMLEQADDIVYPMLPTIADIENFKTFNDDIKTNDRIMPQKIRIVMNQFIKKIKFSEEFNDVLHLVKYNIINAETNQKEDVSYDCSLKIPFSLNVFNFNNNILGTFFITTNGSIGEKQTFLRLASQILPIFKVKSSTEQLERYKRQQIEKEKAKKKAKNTKELAKENSNIAEKTTGQVKTTTKKLDNKKTPESKYSIIAPEDKIEGVREYFLSDLSRETLDSFITNLTKYKEIKCLSSGFPAYDGKKPPRLSKKVYADYIKSYKKEVQRIMKLKAKQK